MIRVLYPIHIDRWTRAPATVLREIGKHNHRVAVYSFSSPRTPEDEELGRQFWQLAHVTPLCYRDLLTRRFDIVHRSSATTANEAAVGLAVHRSWGHCRQVFTLGSEVRPLDNYFPALVRAIRHADVLVATSQAAAESALEQTGRHADKVIPNGVDTEFFSPSRASPETLTRYCIEAPYVLFAGRICYSKRADLFVRLSQLLPKVSFVLVGRPAPEAEYNQIMAMASRCDNVRYLGELLRGEVRDLMAGAVSLVFPSESEGFGLVAVEASAMGLPVLAQPTSALLEVVTNGVNGWLFADDRLDRWVAKIETIMAWPAEERARYAAQARTMVTDKFSWKSIAAQYLEVYEELTRGFG